MDESTESVFQSHELSPLINPDFYKNPDSHEGEWKLWGSLIRPYLTNDVFQRYPSIESDGITAVTKDNQLKLLRMW